MFMFDIVSASITGVVVSIISFLSAVVVYLSSKVKNTKEKCNREENNTSIVMPVYNTVYSSLFSENLLSRYRKKMIFCQPIKNNRILPGSGKDHTLTVISSVVNSKVVMPTVLEQVGDIFS